MFIYINGRGTNRGRKRHRETHIEKGRETRRETEKRIGRCTREDNLRCKSENKRVGERKV